MTAAPHKPLPAASYERAEDVPWDRLVATAQQVVVARTDGKGAQGYLAATPDQPYRFTVRTGRSGRPFVLWTDEVASLAVL